MKVYTQATLIALVVMIFILPGCSKFLDRPLENQTKSSIDYTNLNLMYAPVSGVYKTATRGSGPTTGGYCFWINVIINTGHSDDVDPKSGYPEVYDIIHGFHSTQALKSFWGINDLWQTHYAVIIAANSALAELDEFAKNIPADDAQNKQLLSRYQAEARFFGALSHYWLSRNFGDIPILGKESINANYLDTVGKSKLEDVRKYVMSEMDFCIANLEDARPNEAAHVGGVTQYAARMLKAKAAMDLAGNNNGSPYWDDVLKITDEIINSNKFSLFPDYYQLWKKPGKLCNESILEFQFSDFGNPTGDMTHSGGTESWQNWAGFFFWQAPENAYGAPISGGGWMIPTDNAVNFLRSRNDAIRLKTAIQYCGVNGEPGTYAVTPDGDTVSGNPAKNKYFNGKAYLPKSQMTPGRQEYGANNNIRVFRYAEVLLMNAEARIRKGQNGDAPLNLVRQRVGLAPLSNATIQQLMDERRAELICEWWGERFNDLVRTDQAASVLPGFVKGQSEYFPIPQPQVDRNSNLQ